MLDKMNVTILFYIKIFHLIQKTESTCACKDGTVLLYGFSSDEL